MGRERSVEQQIVDDFQRAGDEEGALISDGFAKRKSHK